MHKFSLWGRRAARCTGLLLALAAPAHSAQNDSTVVSVFSDHPIHFGEASRYDTAEVVGEEGGRIIRRDVDLPVASGPVQIIAHVVVYSTLQEGGDGDPWDRAGTVLLDIPGMAPIELLKFITGFGGRSDLHQDVSDLAPLLSGKRTLRAFVDTWVSPAWKLSFELIYRPVIAPANPDWADGIYYNTGMTATQVGPDKPAVAVNIPPTASQVTLTWYTSGHCTDGTDADEFVSKDNVISVDGVEVYRYKPWRSDCKSFRSRNPRSGRWGTTWSSDYSRSGWCPGDIVYPVRLDLSSQLAPGPHQLRCAVENIRPADASGTGYWRISSYLTGQGDIRNWRASRITLSGEGKKLLPVKNSTPLRIDLVDDSGLPVFAAAARIQVASAADSLLFSADERTWSNPLVCTIVNGSAQLWMKCSRPAAVTVSAEDLAGTLPPAQPLSAAFYDYEVGPDEVNHARGAVARADCECSRTTEGAAKAVDGSLATKWCCNNGTPDWLEVTLPDTVWMNYFIIRHAGAGKAPVGDPGAADGPGMNSQNFSIQLLDSTGAWQTAVAVNGNPADASGSVSYHALPEPLRTGKVRLYLTKPDVSRIYEFEIYLRGASPIRPEDLQDGVLPEQLELLGAWPNPFNSAAAIRFFLPGLTEVRVTVMNSRGQLVARVGQGSLPRGLHTLRWQGRTLDGSPAASGVYYLNLLGIDAAGRRTLRVCPVTLVR
ncbi:MAG TPA: peptide-N-glycosidase F-related protein [bacterium]|nr:peptide-N-glycosidase F-related protein [bacterium]HNW61200.1 peptide-N-glycosidase F-related protein [bacterium]HPR88095.1 peptide-N-glycosidase F-related protein [bacterium]